MWIIQDPGDVFEVGFHTSGGWHIFGVTDKKAIAIDWCNYLNNDLKGVHQPRYDLDWDYQPPKPILPYENHWNWGKDW